MGQEAEAPEALGIGRRLGDTRRMQPYVIITRRITVLGGQRAEIPPEAPKDLRTWTCHAFFVPGAKPDDLRKKIKQQHIDVTHVEGGCWVYGGYSWLEKDEEDLDLR